LDTDTLRCGPARALQQNQALVATALLQEARSQPPLKRIKRSVHHQQQRLQKLTKNLAKSITKY